jgi:hypothetical protein
LRHRYPASIIVALFMAVLLTACTKNERIETLHASLLTVNAARDGFVAWDLPHQTAIVEAATSHEQGAAALAAYQAKRKPVVDGFEVAYRAIALAATQTDDLSLQAALATAGDLIAAVKKLIGDL